MEWEKVACWSTKAAISVKRKSYYGGPIGTHQRSFERYYPRLSTASSSLRLGVRNPTQNCNRYYLKEWVKLRSSNLAGSQGQSEQKPIKILEKKERGCIETVQFFGYPLLSQERVKLRTSNFVRTFIGSIGTNAH